MDTFSDAPQLLAVLSQQAPIWLFITLFFSSQLLALSQQWPTWYLSPLLLIVAPRLGFLTKQIPVYLVGPALGAVIYVVSLVYDIAYLPLVDFAYRRVFFFLGRFFGFYIDCRTLLHPGDQPNYTSEEYYSCTREHYWASTPIQL